MLKKDLKEFDIVKLRNGEIFIVMRNSCSKEGLSLFNNNHGGCYLHIESYSSHLKCRDYPGKDSDIIAVHSSKCSNHLSPWTTLDHFFSDTLPVNQKWFWGWVREDEPVEMTLEEVCKALGKEIKIVKK